MINELSKWQNHVYELKQQFKEQMYAQQEESQQDADQPGEASRQMQGRPDEQEAIDEN